MTVSTSTIWNAAVASTRPASRTADKNIHIGCTLRDLYLDDDVPETEGRFARLLDELQSMEKSDGHH